MDRLAHAPLEVQAHDHKQHAAWHTLHRPRVASVTAVAGHRGFPETAVRLAINPHLVDLPAENPWRQSVIEHEPPVVKYRVVHLAVRPVAVEGHGIILEPIRLNRPGVVNLVGDAGDDQPVTAAAEIGWVPI